MNTPTRARSLTWTVAGIFIVATLLATMAQVLITSGIIHPLEEREARAGAELAATNIARELEAAGAELTDASLDSLLALRRRELGDRPAWLMFQRLDGHVAGSPAARAAWVEPMLPRVGHTSVLGDPPLGSEGPRHMQLLARRVVRREGRPAGQLFVLQPTRQNDLASVLASPSTLASVPVALLLSACVGLFLVRLLVGRLRVMGALAARVAQGDFTVRLGDRTGDEIGRIAEQLDLMTEQLEKARDRATATEEQRRQLFADITHELATPLTSIRANAETLLDPGVPLDGAERTLYLQGVLEEARRLDRLIRDLFDLARLEAGASALTLERLDWVALCRNTTDRFAPRFSQAGLTLRWTACVAEAWIEADGHRMEQVLENLLGNALHYVPRGGQVELALMHTVMDAPRFRLEVSDDGPGVPEAELPQLFERFYRGAGARGSGASHEVGGTGLGLAIVREIVTRHGGRVEAVARRPSGLGVRVEMPVAP